MIKSNRAVQIGFCLINGFLGTMQNTVFADGLTAKYTADQIAPKTVQTFNVTDLGEMVIAPDASIWGVDTKNHRVLHLNVDGSIIGQFGTQGTAAGQLNNPQHIALAKDGSVWVTDGGSRSSDACLCSYVVNYRVQHFKPDGTWVEQFGNPSLAYDILGSKHGVDAIGQFDTIYNIQIAEDGSVWVNDASNYRIQHFKANGSFINQIDHKGPATGQIGFITDMALAADGSVWLVDNDNQRVDHFKADSTFIRQFETKIPSEGALGELVYEGPYRIEMATDGSLWVSYYSTLQHFKTDGTLVAQYGNKNRYDPEPFSNIVDFMLEANGSVWLRDGSSARLRHYAADGSLLLVTPQPSAEYDVKQANLYLRDVILQGENVSGAGQQYQATLQYQNGQFALIDSGLIDAYNYALPKLHAPAYFNPSLNILEIPSVFFAGRSYKAILKHVGNYRFELQTIIPW